MRWVLLNMVALFRVAYSQTQAPQTPPPAPMLRFACSQLVVERLNPLVNPWVIGSPHVHQVVGGNSFNAIMTPISYDLPARSSCTSCTFSEDFSNYWTAALYYRARNRTFKRVEQFPNGGLTQNGGITVYYIPPYDGVSNVTAFTPVSMALWRPAVLCGNPPNKIAPLVVFFATRQTNFAKKDSRALEC